MEETYWNLLLDAPHLEFELTLTLIQDVLIGLVLWPWAKRWLTQRVNKEHLALDAEHGVTHPGPSGEEFRNVRVIP